MTTGQISRDECLALNEALGSRAPNPEGCFVYGHNTGDPFTYPTDKPFKGEDESKHRNSWLWPRMARRLTKNSELHVSQWRKPVEVDQKQCAAIRSALEEKLGAKAAASKLPKACEGL